MFVNAYRKIFLKLSNIIFCGKNLHHIIFYNFGEKNFIKYMGKLFFNQFFIENFSENNDKKPFFDKNMINGRKKFLNPNFNISSPKLHMPFKILYIERFTNLTNENQILFKHEMDQKNLNHIFFFFCENRIQLNRSILSRCLEIDFLFFLPLDFSEKVKKIKLYRILIDKKKKRKVCFFFINFFLQKNFKIFFCTKKKKKSIYRKFYKSSIFLCNEFIYYLIKIIKKKNIIVKKFTKFIYLFFSDSFQKISETILKFYLLKKY
ncbi:hypothetical protein CMESO_97 (nucleomorph) [Chroomonas mesostigmatica CCMP1168]|uniref:Uncharacterized protein n=1 Tax=Chroomonas mesostigmatica CCMP1168 TaxID=1195612 RepID=J7G5E3_9CRYP|nr:hypothetical protein CMESO_97 [Chroomonas mesostigmatica CCMP1168]